eukprot:TRINITY_DN11375_c0_g1_i1.p1 TRINITY_DN11375_c0_g1~~TRINITY_DN11375_c0_g1_i1.p1  ORF type:complete len:498 (-),score=63.23 TRINITY_DN11375_c0_g1_i1:841-2334(-)
MALPALPWRIAIPSTSYPTGIFLPNNSDFLVSTSGISRSISHCGLPSVQCQHRLERVREANTRHHFFLRLGHSRSRQFSSPCPKALPRSNQDDEEKAWEREERRWLREEQRWEREERRWREEQLALKEEIRVLQAALAEASNLPPSLIQRLRFALGAARVQGSDSAIDAELVFKSLGTVEETTSSPGVNPSQASGRQGEGQQEGQVSAQDTLKLIPDADIIAAVASRTATKEGAKEAPVAPKKEAIPAKGKEEKTGRRSLGVGSEGPDVMAMQVLLVSQGFYCGEDDIMNSYFSDDTESAVKTWQATVGVRETGIMTPELLAMLHGEAELPEVAPAKKPTSKSSYSPPSPTAPSVPSPPSSAGKGPTREAPAATREVPEVMRYARTSIEASDGTPQRVYLLGENRWEDPSRISTFKSTPPIAVGASGNPVASKVTGTKCIACRSQGSVTCMECEGTGELNVEEQFLDWLAGEPQCLYCEGKGAVTCDSCDGSGVVKD